MRQVQGAYGAQERSVHEVHEHLSTEATLQLSTGVEFGKKSNEADALALLEWVRSQQTSSQPFNNKDVMRLDSGALHL